MATEVRFVQNLGCAPAQTVQTDSDDASTGGPQLTDGKAQGAIAAGSVVAFVTGVSGTGKSDVLNSTLLAQLGANHAHPNPEKSEMDKWYKKYNEVLQNVGWVIQEMEFQTYKPKSATFKMDEVVLEIIAAIATQNQLLALKATLDALKALPKEDGRLKVFDHSSDTREGGKFQVSICSQDEDGNMAVAFAAFNLKYRVQKTSVLFFDFNSSDVEVKFAKHAMTLNTGVYSQVRDAVDKKLGGHATNYVDTLDIEV